jgi:hypothetical protein
MGQIAPNTSAAIANTLLQRLIAPLSKISLRSDAYCALSLDSGKVMVPIFKSDTV